MAAFRTSRTFDVIFIFAITACLIWAALNRTYVGDQIFFFNYQPSPQVTRVATDAGLSPAGIRLLYRSNPQFTTQAAVAAECDIERLGCLSPHGQAFILDDPSKPTQTIVTAAHEMLHLAYQRLPQAEKDRLAPLLDQAIAMNAAQITNELQDLTTPEDRRDEAHSLLGTEYKKLPEELSAYYSIYFADRTKVLDAAASET